jgi:hypothetical protein
MDPRMVVARFLCEFIGDDPDALVPPGPTGAQPEILVEPSTAEGKVPCWTRQLVHADDLLQRLGWG